MLWKDKKTEKKSSSQEIDDSNKDIEMPFAELECDSPQEVRGRNEGT